MTKKNQIKYQNRINRLKSHANNVKSTHMDFASFGVKNPHRNEETLKEYHEKHVDFEEIKEEEDP